DGIRGPLVTGVQTCALPSSPFEGKRRAGGVLKGRNRVEQRRRRAGSEHALELVDVHPLGIDSHLAELAPELEEDLAGTVVRRARSEERRVGTKCASWWGEWR